MTGFNHGMTGAAIALTVRQPVLAVPLAFASHYAQDIVPHWDYGTGRKDGKIMSRKFNQILIGDFGLSVILMIVLGGLFPAQKWLIWGCMVAAASPDLAWGYYQVYVKQIKRHKVNLDWLSRFHQWIEWSETRAGVFIEIVWFVAAGGVILGLK